MLYQSVSSLDLKTTLKPREQYRPFPAYYDRAAWAALPDEVKSYYSGLARGFFKTDFLSPLRAVRYMDYLRNGNRDQYEGLYFPRRAILIALTVAECIAGDGALIDDIIDIVWAICEETSWVIPAHNSGSGAANSLPDIEAPVYIDLFSAETGSALTWVYYFLGDTIAGREPLVKRRIEIEIMRRILDPFLADDTFDWKGLTDNNPVNNWNPWINSNILTAFLLLETNEARRIDGVLRTAKSIQRFLDCYFPDGGCDEGPGYFNVAGASLFDYLEEIHYATGGAVDIYKDPLISNIAKYIYRVHIGGEYYVNFADASPRVKVSAGLLSRMGKLIGDEVLTRFGEYMIAAGWTIKPYELMKPYELGYYEQSQLYRFITGILSFTPCRAASYSAPRDHFFNGIQVMTARYRADSTEGIFVAFKGGHNEESHNHNDVGSFIVYNDGKPVVIDAGVETYTRFTFSDQRYDIWTMRSDYHNLPVINGCVQFPGPDAKASDVKYSVDGGVTKMSLDISGAYPKEAALKSYKRTVQYDRDKKAVAVNDEYELRKAEKPMVNYIMFFNRPELAKPGQIVLGGLTMAYDPSVFVASVERITITDLKLRVRWDKDELFRLCLSGKTAEEKGAYSFEFF